MTKYELYKHAGVIPYADWKQRGIELPIFDKDGTLTHFNRLDLVDEVIDGMVAQEFPDIYPEISIVSNNHDHDHVEEFAELLGAKLGVGVYAVSRAQGHQGKPHPEMGIHVAEHFGLEPEQIGVIGDRRLTDVKFGRNMGAGVAALCHKVGEGDADWVPTLRVLESSIVMCERVMRRAAKVRH